MYSSSNSFLGGANSARPGSSPFGQQPVYSQFPQGQQQQQQPTGFMPQPTGFGGGQLQPQPTGFPGGQLQPQFTGYPGASAPPQQSFQAPAQQPQFTGYSTQSQPPPQPTLQQPTLQLPQQQFPATTGAPPAPVPKTSSQIAQSFQDAAPQPPPKSSSGSKIPNIRLSFITAQDQAKFEQLFKSAVGDSKTMSG